MASLPGHQGARAPKGRARPAYDGATGGQTPVDVSVLDVKIAWLLPTVALLSACASTGSAPTPASIRTQQPPAYQQLAITSDLAPPPRDLTAMVYFPPLAEIVLFGGDENDHSVGDTWAFNQHGWTELHPATSPAARAQFAMAYDPALREIVLYGGCTACGSLGFHIVQDTWAFDGTTWRQMTSLHLPTYEPSPLLSWDTATRTLVLLAPPPGYGVNPPNGDFNSSGGALGRWSWRTAGWTWDGSPPGPPLMIQGASFVPEPGSSTMLYYSYQPYSGSCPSIATGFRCGSDPTGLRYSQTWTWDGRAFTREAPTVAPVLAAVVSDPRVGSVVAVTKSQVWIWSGTTWQVIASNVPPTVFGPAEYDPELGDVVVLGSTTSANPRTVTWVWDGSTWMTAAGN
jgi:hypothetical protein